MNYLLTKNTRIKMGRSSEPSAGIVDSQSVKTTEKGALKVMMEERRSRVVKGIYSKSSLIMIR